MPAAHISASLNFDEAFALRMSEISSVTLTAFVFGMALLVVTFPFFDIAELPF